MNPRSSGPQPDALGLWATPTALDFTIIAEKRVGVQSVVSLFGNFQYTIDIFKVEPPLIPLVLLAVAPDIVHLDD